MTFIDKLADIEKKYDQLTGQLGDAALLADPAAYQKTAKAQSDLAEVVEKYRQWKEIQKSLADTRMMLAESASDPALKQMAEEEIAQLENRLVKVEDEIKTLLLPRDPNDEKNVVLEIRAGTGGDEATLFA